MEPATSGQSPAQQPLTLERAISHPLVRLGFSALIACLLGLSNYWIHDIRDKQSTQGQEIHELQLWRAAHEAEHKAEKEAKAQQLRQWSRAVDQSAQEDTEAVRLYREILAEMKKSKKR